jgi:hypothetical protein
MCNVNDDGGDQQRISENGRQHAAMKVYRAGIAVRCATSSGRSRQAGGRFAPPSVTVGAHRHPPSVVHECLMPAGPSPTRVPTVKRKRRRRHSILLLLLFGACFGGERENRSQRNETGSGAGNETIVTHRLGGPSYGCLNNCRDVRGCKLRTGRQWSTRSVSKRS